MHRFVYMESPYPLIQWAQPIVGLVIVQNQDGLNNGGHGLCFDPLPLNFLNKIKRFIFSNSLMDEKFL